MRYIIANLFFSDTIEEKGNANQILRAQLNGQRLFMVFVIIFGGELRVSNKDINVH